MACNHRLEHDCVIHNAAKEIKHTHTKAAFPVLKD